MLEPQELVFSYQREVFLDLVRDNLYGWETPQSKQRVDKYLEALKDGAMFPAVAAYEVDNDFYLTPTIELPNGLPDGGHHRAIAHFLGGVPLRVRVLFGGGVPYTRRAQLNVREMKVA